MKRTLVLAVVLYLVALAATGEARSENTEARAQSAAAVDGQSAVVGHPSPVDGGADAITIPQMLSYQGKLTDTLGQPVADTVYAIRFRLYAQLSGGTQFWEENQNVKTTGGLFSVLLGSVTPIVSVPDAGSLYLGLQVGAGGELAPRLRIASAAYAYKADTANYAIAAGSGGDDAWVRGGDSVLYTVHRLGLAKGEGQNAILGPSAHTHVNFGFRCTTGLTGQDRFHIAVGGGRNNVASGSHSTIAGGSNNRAAGDNANVAGGQSNSAAAYASEVGGGLSNTASGTYSVVGGGYYDVALGDYSVVGGGRADSAVALYSGVLSGYRNVAGDATTDTAAVVAGGYANRALAKYAFVGGGRADTVSAEYGAALGGWQNRAGNEASDTGAAVVGGYFNRVFNKYGFIGGGSGNTAAGIYATVGGGSGNVASGVHSTVGGGTGNTASGWKATIAGGGSNVAETSHATVGGGTGNTASGSLATVGGGWGNSATRDEATVGGGLSNTASGYYSTVPGGYNCAASGNHSFAAGSHAKARGDGSFVWSDSCDSYDSVRTTTANRWVARARGGVYFYTNLGRTTGSYLSAGGSSWNSVSDSMTKENFRPVDKKALLEALARMRVRDYNLKSQDKSIRHIGPVAQDFHNAFGFGESNTAINMEDADGVLMAAVQALYEQNQFQQAEIEALKARLAELK